MHLECLERKLVVRRDEDHGHVLADKLQNVEAIELWHLHVEQQEIHRVFAHGFHGFESVRALSHDGHAAERREILTHGHTGRLFVVNDDYAQQLRHGHVLRRES